MRIEQREDVVIINGLEISGSIQKNKKCTTCQSQIIYDDTFDSYFCASCNEWLEEACEDPHCTYCVQRPDSPLSDNR
ncbi:hypothetical protein SAMN02787079_01092 [Lysinibacillus sp. TC-37]|uniref:Uncharacterized protein n=1 Tax=Lysinibacillus fusiformis TaxID=28031 RepID=A0A2I0UZ18_9BACI|nr:hypothetical protein CRI88_11250 [Lysinibacillus fusiformis]SCY05805.1 hypothetical protein SAMN02787078_00679 [Lysinibacillus sp. SG9]SDB14063.1 hypothetical protein SAMN02787079_01092 [Lysinibacillus sp. TC-37]SFS52961.1 hypothetical protein SAMN02787087_01096 [Lysinibacillus sp. SG55]